MSGKLPLLVRKNIAANESKRDEAMEIVNKTLGGTWTFEVDFNAVHDQLQHSHQKELVAEMVYKYLEVLAKNISKKAADETLKDAINAAAPSRKITFSFGTVPAGVPDKNHHINFDNGTLNLIVPLDLYGNTVEYVGHYIDRQVAHTSAATPSTSAHGPPTAMPVKTSTSATSHGDILICVNCSSPFRANDPNVKDLKCRHHDTPLLYFKSSRSTNFNAEPVWDLFKEDPMESAVDWSELYHLCCRQRYSNVQGTGCCIGLHSVTPRVSSRDYEMLVTVVKEKSIRNRYS
ncbi:hypothetical protein HK104_008425 [Borealophlyctis nickersoniae]|nr:hypothetical protein HK104_008425 [Borealophlyctis nickersoniae]